MANNNKACDCGAPRFLSGDCKYGCKAMKDAKKAESARMAQARAKQHAALVDAEKVRIDTATLGRKVADLNPQATARYIDASRRATTGWKKARR